MHLSFYSLLSSFIYLSIYQFKIKNENSNIHPNKQTRAILLDMNYWKFNVQPELNDI